MKLIPEFCKVSNDRNDQLGPSYPTDLCPSSNSGTNQQGPADSSPATSWVGAGRLPLVFNEEVMGCKGERKREKASFRWKCRLRHDTRSSSDIARM